MVVPKGTSGLLATCRVGDCFSRDYTTFEAGARAKRNTYRHASSGGTVSIQSRRPDSGRSVEEFVSIPLDLFILTHPPLRRKALYIAENYQKPEANNSRVATEILNQLTHERRTKDEKITNVQL